MGLISTVIITLLVFMVIIIIHELGHFFTAKRAGVKVHEFSIGLGPSLYSREKGGTKYSLRVIPIGGYVKLEGEDAESEDENALNKKKPWVRLVVLSAGAILNILMGLVIFAMVFMQMNEIKSLKIDALTPDYPAMQAGVGTGDIIIGANGQRFLNYQDMMLFMNYQGNKPFSLMYQSEKDGKIYKTDLTPKLYDNGKQKGYIIGVTTGTEKMNFGLAIKNSGIQTVFVSKMIITTFSNMFTGRVPVTDLSGPIGAGAVIGQAASRSTLDLMFIFAFLSVNIGVFNLLPFPALDGGRIIFVLVEMIRRKPIDPNKEGYVHMIGIILLLALMVVVTSSDIYKSFMGLLGK